MSPVSCSGAAFLLVDLPWCAGTAPAAEEASRPNVVIIQADDLGYAEPGSSGQPRSRVSELDQVARARVRLTHFSSTRGDWAPSRASQMTKPYPLRNGMMLSSPHPWSERGGSEVADRLGLLAEVVPLGEEESPHEALFSCQRCLGRRCMGKEELHRQVPGPDPRPADWIVPPAPDRVALLVSAGEPLPADHPGVQTGDRPRGRALFALKPDPAEQRDLSAKYPKILEQPGTRFEPREAEARRESKKATQ